jgi:hypothetical protein
MDRNVDSNDSKKNLDIWFNLLDTIYPIIKWEYCDSDELSDSIMNIAASRFKKI